MNEAADDSDMLFVRNELLAHSNILKVTISQIEQGSHTPDMIAVAIKSAHLIEPILNSAQLTVLLPLFQGLERFFQAIKPCPPIDKRWINTLASIIENLTSLASAPGQAFYQLLNDLRVSIDQWILELNEAVHQTKLKKPSQEENLSSKNDSISSTIKSPASGKVDGALISLFLQELGVQAERMTVNLKIHKKDSLLEQPLKDWAQITRSIKQASHLVKLELIVEIAQTLENYAQALLEKKVSETQEGLDLCFHIIELLASLSSVEPDHLPFFLQEKQGRLVELNQGLASLISKASSSPKKVAKEEKIKIAEGGHADSAESMLDEDMFDLFRIELETQCRALNYGLVELEKNKDPILLEELMRAAHSIKGAARIVALNPLVKLSHAMEDCFVHAQNKKKELSTESIDCLLQMVDFLSQFSQLGLADIQPRIREQASRIEELINELNTVSKQEKVLSSPSISKPSASPKEPSSINFPAEGSVFNDLPKQSEAVKPFQPAYPNERILRVTVQNLNRLMGLAGESLVESRWLHPFGENLQKLRKAHNEIATLLDTFRNSLQESCVDDRALQYLTDIQHRINETRYQLTENLGELDSFIRRHANLSDRLYQEVINSRMRPFSDGVEAFPRMIRDLARQLDKQVRLEIEGQSTPVDRDILEKLEAPLSHLLRNAVDHGIENPKARLKAGKPAEGVIHLKAYHRGGMLGITVADDGKGIDVEELRKKIVEKNLASPEMARSLTESEVIDFIFLPGFSTASKITEISGRGVGLNVVRNIVQEVGGVVRTSSTLGKGTSFNLQLPLTLSVIRALLVKINEETYAFPLARIDQAMLINRKQIEVMENRQYFHYEGQNIGLVSAWQVLELDEPQINLETLPVIVLSERSNSYGLVVDCLIGEKELVVQELDSRLGKVSDIIAGALMEDGTPILIIDVEDIVRSIDNLLSGSRLTKISYARELPPSQERKRVLVVDDSITVREVECRLLQNQGYEVETAVNGIDGWNAVRSGHYDLVITDIDMPRMNGIDLVRAIKNDPQLHNLPVMIVSYKEEEEDRMMGLAAGADYYLTKSSFHDTTLLAAVNDLIGKP